VIRQEIARTMMVASVLSCALLQLGCQTHEQPSAVIAGYTFSRDFDGERRVLRIEPSAEEPAECMQAQLPTGDGAQWKETNLAPTLHRALIDLLFDEARFPYYNADAAASAAVETFLCSQRPGGGGEFCYAPQVSVTGVSSPWRFGLQPEVTLSDQSKALIDAFLHAHDACWHAGTPMNGGG
jgi:hypothetical protein